MKNNILKIVNEVYKRPEFLNKAEVSLTINYKKEIPDYNNVIFNDESYENIKNILSGSDVKNYNMTFVLERGTDNIINFNYDEDWKSVYFTFYGGKSDEEDLGKFDVDNQGLFVFRLLGASGDINTDNIPKLRDLRVDTYDRVVKDKRYNVYKYDEISKLIDILLEFDALLDKQLQEKFEIYNKIRNLNN